MKIYKILVAAFVFSSIFVLKVNALSLEPASGKYSGSQQVKINVVANPSNTNQNALQLRLKIENGEFIDFEAKTDPSYIAVIKDCTGEAFFTKTNVCASYARTKPITKGEILGVVTIKFNDNSLVKITKQTENGYSDGVKFFEDSGEAAEYVVGVPISPSVIPTDAQGNALDTSNATTANDISQLYPVIAVALIVGLIVFLIVVQRSGFLKKKGREFIVVGFIVGTGLILFLGYLVLQNQAAKSSSASVNCTPSVQARFRVVVEGVDKGLVNSGSYRIDKVTQLDFTAVTNMQTNPPQYFTGTLNVTGPDGYSQNVTGGSPRQITPVKVGTYNMKATNSQGECDNATVTITPAPAANCTTINFSEWSECINGRQTRTIVSTLPAGCTLQGDPQLGRTCTPVSVTPEVDPCIIYNQTDCNAQPTASWCSNVSRCFPKADAPTVNCNQGQSNPEINARIDTACDIASTITCGPMDSNNDGKFTIIDFAQFARVYGKNNCNDRAIPYSPCGGNDIDRDGEVDIVDFAHFANLYDEPSCSLIVE